jgi:tetratricopeptide (TPR) repeat protein
VISPEAPIQDLESLLDSTYNNRRLQSRIRKMLAMFYREAGREHVREILWSEGRIMSALVSIREHRESRGKLDDKLAKALEMLSAASWRGDPKAFSASARFYKDLAEWGVLVAKAHGFEFAQEIAWLNEQAKDSYELALRRDPMDVESYIGMSQVLRQLGQPAEATTNLQKALPILNKAIQADASDEQSYSERAEAFEELSEIDQAISDLQHVLTLTTREFEIDRVRGKIDKLRKSTAVDELR